MKSPILFLIFKRKDTTERVFNRIREARPPKLYIAADGPRLDRPEESFKCAETRRVVENIDWPCEVHRLYQDKNLGCGVGVSTAITWFFSHEEQGIIIEDDILAHLDFFKYCDEMLERYRNNEKVHIISGNNYFYDGYQSEDSYYFTNYMNIWGWASWRRVWKTYHFDLNEVPADVLRLKLYKRLPKKSASYFWEVFNQMRLNNNDTWDFQFLFNQFYYDRYSISPYTNMVKNIGVANLDSAHFVDENFLLTNQTISSPYPLSHPVLLSTDKDAEKIAMKNSNHYKKSIIDRILNKIKKSIHG